MRTNAYATLAHCCRPRRSILIGDDGIISTLFSSAGELTSKIVKNVQDQSAAEQAGKDSAAALQASITADANAVDALTAAIISADTKSSSADADKMLADQAAAAQDAAAAGLSTANQKKRAAAAKDLLAKATKAWQAAAASKDDARTKAAQARVKAAGVTNAKAQNALVVASAGGGGGGGGGGSGGGGGGDGGSWLTRRALGPIPGWGVLLGGLGILGGGIALILKMRK